MASVKIDGKTSLYNHTLTMTLNWLIAAEVGGIALLWDTEIFGLMFMVTVATTFFFLSFNRIPFSPFVRKRITALPFTIISMIVYGVACIKLVAVLGEPENGIIAIFCMLIGGFIYGSIVTPKDKNYKDFNALQIIILILLMIVLVMGAIL